MAKKANDIHVKISEDPRMEEILDLCTRYTALDFSQRIQLDSSKDDDLSALVVGLDTLGEELEYLVNTETRQKAALQAATDEQKLINKELEQFIYISSHDLQEPLRTIESFTNLIEQQFLPELPEDLLPLFGFIQQSVTRMSAQVFDLLNYLRVIKGDKYLRVNLNAITENQLLKHHRQIEQLQAQLIVEKMGKLIAYEEQMDVLIDNLISNALKFAHPERPPIVKIWSEDTEGGVMLNVQDNGIGIEDKYFPKIFQIFQRLHDKKNLPGTGMGLALCDKIAKNHGGYISVQSVPDSGSKFTVFIQDGFMI